MAVGESENTQTLAEAWDGINWSVVPTPSPGGRGATLTSVSCTISTSCVAVGADESDDYAWGTFVESWDGSAWSVISSPNVGNESNYLNSVSCTSSTSCVAVGYDFNGNYYKRPRYEAFIESWDGSTWAVVPSPPIPAHGVSDSTLNGVSCTSSISCVAVGYFDHEKYNPENLVESWDGTSWSVIPSPNPGTADSADLFNGVSCTSPTNCVAAGSSTTSNVRIALLETTTPLTISTTTLPDGTLGQPYSATLAAVSGDLPYRWELAKGSGRLSKGLRLDRTTGVISGTPTARSFTSTFTVEVFDTKTTIQPRVQHTAEETFTITISPAHS